MKDLVKLENIDIQIGKETLSLTKEQVLELRDILNDMFQIPIPVNTTEHHHHSYDWPIHINPLYIQPQPTTLPYWTVYCSYDGASSNYATGRHTNIQGSNGTTAVLELNS